MWDRPGFFRVVCALLSLLSAFPLLGAGLPQSRALPKSQSLLPAAIKGVIAAVIWEMAVLLFLERGLETGGAQVRHAARAAAAPGERAPGIWLCPGLELHFAQPGAAFSVPRGFLLDEHGLEHSAQEHLLCWAARGCVGAQQLWGVQGAPRQPCSNLVPSAVGWAGWEQPL